MAVMLEKLYRALLAANVPEQQAAAAAAELVDQAATKADVELIVEKAKNEITRWVTSVVLGATVLQALVAALLLRFLK